MKEKAVTTLYGFPFVMLVWSAPHIREEYPELADAFLKVLIVVLLLLASFCVGWLIKRVIKERKS